jgi:predicted enzyme related to lactoylglutathione lyase
MADSVNPVGWFEIYVQDMPRARAFYEAVFAQTLTPIENPDVATFPGMEMWGFPMDTHQYGASGALIKMPGFKSGSTSFNSTLVYFSCEDCAIEAEKAVKAGGHLHRPKTAIGPYGFIALVVDAEGNLIGLHSMV